MTQVKPFLSQSNLSIFSPLVSRIITDLNDFDQEEDNRTFTYMESDPFESSVDQEILWQYLQRMIDEDDHPTAKAIHTDVVENEPSSNGNENSNSSDDLFFTPPSDPLLWHATCISDEE
jgi:hypothetical protein